MIVHETIGMAKPVVALDRVSENREKRFTISCPPKDAFPGVSPRGYMIDCSWKFQSKWSRHDGLIVKVLLEMSYCKT